MDDLFESGAYSARDIEVLEGLEPVRRRPGMYIGGTDERALHHLAAEVLDNAMDEVVAGQASRVEMHLAADGTLSVTDNGRGIPVDAHPKFPQRSALEVVLTTLHSGGKFGAKVYVTAGGLHGVGLSVVNALSDRLSVEVARARRLWRQSYVRGAPVTKLEDAGAISNRRGTAVAFHPDPQIFGAKAGFRPARLYRMARAKAYLFRGVEIRWSCDPALLAAGDDTPASAVLHYPGGLGDYLATLIEGRPTCTPAPFTGEVAGPEGRLEWAIAWTETGEPHLSTYCNTIPTAQGGTHEAGLRTALTRGLRAYGELARNRAAQQIGADDVLGGAVAVLSVFIENPQFQGQTKERLGSPEAARLVEGALKDRFEHWLSGDPQAAQQLLDSVIERCEDRLRRRQEREISRKTAVRKLRLPGKLTDCTLSGPAGTEIFLVEGDSAGGSAKQARARATQAILPLRGKILNVASASAEKLRENKEIGDIVQALGCGVRQAYDENKLRYERVIIMSDADVDGAHIASLLMTFFYREMRPLIENGHLYLAQPPLYRLVQGAKSAFARDDAHRDALLATEFKGSAKVEISRFKGLGEMLASQLRETTMDPARRTLLRIELASEARDDADRQVETLMGRRPELRFAFIQENARFVEDLDV